LGDQQSQGENRFTADRRIPRQTKPWENLKRGMKASQTTQKKGKKVRVSKKVTKRIEEFFMKAEISQEEKIGKKGQCRFNVKKEKFEPKRGDWNVKSVYSDVLRNAASQ